MIFDAVRDANRALDAEDDNAAAALSTAALELADVLGLVLGRVAAPADASGASDDDEIDALVDRRLDAKAKKNFGEADRIRDELTARGVVLEDTPRGTAWRRG